MANPPCMSEDGRQAVFVGTMLSSGDAVALCDECMVPWAAAILHAMTGVDPTPFLAAVSEDEQPTGVTEQQAKRIQALAEEGSESAEGPTEPAGPTSAGSPDPGTADAPAVRREPKKARTKGAE